MAMRTARVSISGVTPILQNNPQCVDRFNKFARRMSAINAKKTRRTDDDYLELRDIEIESKVYFDSEIGVYVPASWVMEAMACTGFKVAKISRADNQVALTFAGENKLNILTVSGNNVRDAEIRYLTDGTAVANFSVADNIGADKKAIFWECSLFGKRAESLAQYLKKGVPVTVIGQVSEREYTAKDGTTKKAFSVRVTDVALQGGKRDEGTSYAPQQGTPTQQKPAAKPMTAGTDLDDEIPF